MSRDLKDKWINTVITSLKQTDENVGAMVLQECGKQCCKDSGILAKAQDLRKRAVNLSDDQKFELMQNELFNTDCKAYKQGGMIYLEYNKCFCLLQDENIEHSDFLCECTKGYAKALFETVYKKPAEITLLNTIIRGGEKCVLAVRIC